MYERFGVPEYWVVDLKARTLTVFVLRDGRYAALPPEGAVRSAVLPDLDLRPTDLFAGIPA